MTRHRPSRERTKPTHVGRVSMSRMAAEQGLGRGTEALTSLVMACLAMAEHELGCQTRNPSHEGRGSMGDSQAWARLPDRKPWPRRPGPSGQWPSMIPAMNIEHALQVGAAAGVPAMWLSFPAMEADGQVEQIGRKH